MNYDEIITFLEIIQQGSITQAASNLYISQGTASARIQSLEEKLGISLFYRQQGIRKIMLTPQGEQFLILAQQYISLWDEAKTIQHNDTYQHLKLACTDTINRLLLNDFYYQFMKKYPNIVLSIQTEHATQIYEMIENQKIDLGIANNLHTYKNVVAKPLYNEEIVLLHYPNCTFQPHEEIHLNYSTSYNTWYKQTFPDTDHPKITLGTISMIDPFLKDNKAWVLVKKSVAQSICHKNSQLVITTLENSFISTTYYYHNTHLKPWTKPIIKLFLKELNIFLQKNKIKSLPD